MNFMVWVWLGVVAAAVFVEAATLTLLSIWFAVGALAATFAAYWGAVLTTQLLIFVGVSIAAFAVIRPIAERFASTPIVPTNADRLIGGSARVTEEIDNAAPSGAVYIDGKTWTARSADGKIIPAGEMVEVAGMEGVKLVVRPKAATPVMT